jgi:hypothetical protein
MNKVRYYNFVGELLGEDGEVLCDEPRFVDVQSYEALERRVLAAERALEEAAEIIRMLEGKFERYNLIKFVDDVPRSQWERV